MREIPVIMISALEEIDSVVRCVAMGAEDYLPKPFNPVLLRARIGACIEKKRLRDQEVDYLRQVARVTLAAGSVESGDFDPASLAEVATRHDALARPTRVFQRMAQEVYAREQRLRGLLGPLKLLDRFLEVGRSLQPDECGCRGAGQQLQDVCIVGQKGVAVSNRLTERGSRAVVPRSATGRRALLWLQAYPPGSSGTVSSSVGP